MEHVVAAPAGGIVRAHRRRLPATRCSRATPLVVHRGARRRRRRTAEASARRRSRRVRGRPRRGAASATRSTLDAAPPGRGRAAAQEPGQRTARENVDDLCDPGSFVEYGALALAAQRQRRALDDLIERTPADGLVAGHRPRERRRCSTTSARAARSCRTTTPCSPARRASRTTARRTACSSSPSACGSRSCSSPRAAAAGRATPTRRGVAGLDCMAFALFGRLSGLVPLVGIAPAAASPATPRCSAAAT